MQLHIRVPGGIREAALPPWAKLGWTSLPEKAIYIYLIIQKSLTSLLFTAFCWECPWSED